MKKYLAICVSVFFQKFWTVIEPQKLKKLCKLDFPDEIFLALKLMKKLKMFLKQS